jgi:hypothetical protein
VKYRALGESELQVWDLGYVSSDKEESNDTQEESEGDESEPKTKQTVIDYDSPENQFCLINVSGETLKAEG